MDNQQNLTELDELTESTSTPWKYRESFILLLLLFAIGALLEFLTNDYSIPIPQMPFSIYIGFVFVSAIIFLYINYQKNLIIQWLSGVPAAISAIVGFVICLLCIALLPQKIETTGIMQHLGLTHIKTSYLFIIMQIYLLTVLGFVILRRILPIRWKNIGFFLNHLGLWITIASFGLGSGDLKRLTINLLENEKESNIGISHTDEMFKLPFTIKLLDFTIEEYDPKLIIINALTGKNQHDTPKPFPPAHVGVVAKYNHWYIYIKKYIPNAIFTDSSFQATDLPGSYPAAYLEIIDLHLKNKKNKWVSVGNLYQEPQYFELDSSRFVSLSQPEPKRYYSKLAIAADSTKSDTILLEVNKPHEINGWKLYQSSYDVSKGKWSTLSVLEAVNDPWIKAVYTGLAMLFIGAFIIIWTGKNKE